ncbi:MAG: hypothetical protein ACYCPW_03775 [Nitrososphaerales archaeon]
MEFGKFPVHIDESASKRLIVVHGVENPEKAKDEYVLDVVERKMKEGYVIKNSFTSSGTATNVANLYFVMEKEAL